MRAKKAKLIRKALSKGDEFAEMKQDNAPESEEKIIGYRITTKWVDGKKVKQLTPRVEHIIDGQHKNIFMNAYRRLKSEYQTGSMDFRHMLTTKYQLIKEFYE